jgi:Putative polyhydroxyalkanoic acid system protein (PHA_gran_rgn)
MAEPTVITVSHQLGRDEAKRRLDEGLDHARKLLNAGYASLSCSWEEYRLDFTIDAIGGHVEGHTTVQDDLVRVEIRLPILFRMLAGQIVRVVSDETSRMLAVAPEGQSSQGNG